MKDLFQFALLATLVYIFVDSSDTASSDDNNLDISAKRPPLEAPVVPSFVLTHDQVSWFDDLLNSFNTSYIQGKHVLDACQADEVRPEAATLIARENADRPLNIGQLCDLFDSVNDWGYVNDPAGRDYFAHPAESHRTRRGDCDDYAIYLGSLASAVGFEVDIVVGVLPSGQNHAFPEVCLGRMDVEVVREYLCARYNLHREPIYFRNDAVQNLYISLERGVYPGAVHFDGRVAMRLFLTDHFVEHI